MYDTARCMCLAVSGGIKHPPVPSAHTSVQLQLHSHKPLHLGQLYLPPQDGRLSRRATTTLGAKSCFQVP